MFIYIHTHLNPALDKPLTALLFIPVLRVRVEHQT